VSETRSNNSGIGSIFGALVFGGFIAVKLAGTSLAAWSWFWLLLPIVPVLSLVVKHFGL
jgi:predicted ABC-type sugar transport system permease subunit